MLGSDEECKEMKLDLGSLGGTPRSNRGIPNIHVNGHTPRSNRSINGDTPRSVDEHTPRSSRSILPPSVPQSARSAMSSRSNHSARSRRHSSNEGLISVCVGVGDKHSLSGLPVITMFPLKQNETFQTK